MKSPFAIFRKHQKVLMVVLTGLAMFAFVVLDSLGQDRGDLFLPILCGLVGMALVGLFGWQRGDAVKFGAVGLAAGIVIGVILLQTKPGEKFPVETAMGNLSYQDLQNLLSRRQTANTFIVRAFQKAYQPVMNNPMMAELMEQQVQDRLFGFGRPDLNDDVVFGFLLDKEADDLGIAVSDEAVSDYINRMTGRKLTQADFNEVVKSLRIGESQLFNALRGEIRARLAMEMLAPRSPATPEVFWEDYRKLGVTETLEVAAVPVADFIAEAPNPTDEQVTSYFETWKGVPAAYPGSPGLLQARRIQIEQLEAEFTEVEKEVSAKTITDEEVKKYYEQHREEYRTRPKAGSSAPLDSVIKNPLGGEGPLLGPPTSNGPSTPGKATSPPPVNATPQKPAPSSQKTAPEKQPSAKPPEQKAPATKDASKPGASLDRKQEQSPLLATSTNIPSWQTVERQAGDRPMNRGSDGRSQMQLVAYQPAAAAKSAAPQPAAKSSVPTATAPTKTSPAAVSPAIREPKAPAMPELPAKGGSSQVQPEYRPLDEILQREIRDVILRTRTLDAMKAKIQAAYDFLSPLRDQLIPSEPGATPKLSAKDREKLLSDYAAKHHLKYSLLPALSAQELDESSEKYPIAAAVEPIDDPFQRREPMRVIQLLFTSQPDDLYQPYQAEVPDSYRFAYWKVADKEAHIPTLDEPGVREQAVRGWKITEFAQKAAKERADQLAELVRKSKKPMAEALASQTITKKGPAVSVVPTPPFSWITVQSAAPRDMMPDSMPRRSQIAGVSDPDNDFMKTVFDEMQVGDVRVVPNLGQRILYVVKVKTRHPADEAEKIAFRARFLNENFFGSGMFMGGRTTYEYLNMDEQQQLMSTWAQQLYVKYQVRMNLENERRGRGQHRAPLAG